MSDSFQIETQQRFLWCWAAVTSTVAHYFFPDSPLTQCRIAKEVLHKNDGVNCCDFSQDICDDMAPLGHALEVLNGLLTPDHLNNDILPVPNLPMEGIKAQIDIGRPVCARVEWVDDNTSHFVMIAGYSQMQSGDWWIDVFDPYWEDSTVPYNEFLNSYLSAGKWAETYLVGQP